MRGRGPASRLAAFVVIAVFTLGPAAAHAGETDSFRFQPHPLTVQGEERRTFSYELPAETSVTDAVQITNKTDEVRRFRIYGADASEDGSGNVTVDGFDAPKDGVGSWIEVPETEHSLLPRSSEVVDFSLARPPGQTGKGVGAIVAEEISEPTSGGGIQVVFRIAILVRIEGDRTGLQLGEPQLSTPIQLVPSDGTAEVELTNSTLQPIEAEVSLTVESLTGRQWPLEPVTVTLEPGGATTVEQDWPTVPRWGGLFEVRASATWEAGTVARSSSRGLYPPLWLLALAILAVGVRSLREMWSRREEGRGRRGEPAPDPDALPEHHEHQDDTRVEELVGS